MSSQNGNLGSQSVRGTGWLRGQGWREWRRVEEEDDGGCASFTGGVVERSELLDVELGLKDISVGMVFFGVEMELVVWLS